MPGLSHEGAGKVFLSLINGQLSPTPLANTEVSSLITRNPHTTQQGIFLLLHASVTVLHFSQPRPQICRLLGPRCVVLFVPCLALPSCYTPFLYRFFSGLENERWRQLLLPVPSTIRYGRYSHLLCGEQ